MHCGVTLTRAYTKINRKILPLLKEYVLKGRTYASLSCQSGISIRSLENYFHHLLNQTPPVQTLPLTQVDPQYLTYDGLWFGKQFCFMVYQIHKDPLVIHYSIRKTERASQIASDLRVIKDTGYTIDGIVTDGGKGVTKAASLVFPFTPHQICLAHIHRQATIGLGRYPKDIRTRKLRSLADHVWLIESKEALSWWLDKLKRWARVNRTYLREYGHDSEVGRWWYKHKNARKTLRVLLKAGQTSFKFLSYPLMPKTTNGLEGMFSNLRIKWQVHKGLKQERWPSFLKWFIYFRNRQILSDRKRKIP